MRRHFLLQMNRVETVSSVKRGKAAFCVTVYPQVDYMFVAALVVILEEVQMEQSLNDVLSGAIVSESVGAFLSV